MYYIGIDPGKKGAMALLDKTGLVKSISDNKSEHLSVLKHILSDVGSFNIVVYLEKVHSMPQQGVVSTFSFGTEYGWWFGVLDAFEIPYRLVPPIEWQKALHIPKGIDKKNHKVLIFEAARKLYPSVPLTGERGGILDGRSDALMLARYCYLEDGA